MRIVLFGEILERHVVESLHRALEQRGHEVTSTGKVWHGSSFPATSEEHAEIRAVVDSILEDPPDALLNFRTAALLPDDLADLKGAGVFLAAWFSDDPVLWATTTRVVADHYDLLLHTGGERVLAHYEKHHGRSGVTFPYWTDEIAYPRGYAPESATVDVVFLGHASTPAKAWRYSWLAEAARHCSLEMYGGSPPDSHGIVKGRLGSDAEIVTAVSRARFGLNISQRFSDYRGTQYDFPGLSEMGEFPVPSRVVALAAIGVPIITLRTDATDPGRVWDGMFPEVLTVDSPQELGDVVAANRDPDRLLSLSMAAHERFLRHFHARHRAAVLERLLSQGGGVITKSRRERAWLYTQT